MNLLLDTHTLLWFLNDDPQLVPTAKALIEDPTNRKFVSVASCWEIAIKVGLKKLDLGEPDLDGQMVDAILRLETTIDLLMIVEAGESGASDSEVLARNHRLVCGEA